MFRSHRHYKNKITKKHLAKLNKTRHFLNVKALYKIFNSLFLSNVRYGLLCCIRANKKCINDFNVPINRALRCNRYKKCDACVRELKTQKKKLGVKNLYLYELDLFMFKINNNLLPANFDNFYKSVKKTIIIIRGLRK